MADKNNENDENNKTSENDKNNKNNKGNNFGGFISALISVIIQILVIGLIGANLVYFSGVSSSMFFPTDVNSQPYTESNSKNPSETLGSGCGPFNYSLPERDKETGKINRDKYGMSSTMNKMSTNFIDITSPPENGKGGSKTYERSSYIRNLFEYGFPYNLGKNIDENTDLSELSWGEWFGTWFSNKVSHSFIWLRIVETSLVQFFTSFCSFFDEKSSFKTLIPFISGPIVLGILIFAMQFWMIASFITFFLYENLGFWGYLLTFVGLIIPWTWFLLVGLTFVQSMFIAGKYTFLPLMLNMNIIRNIMFSNKSNVLYLKIIGLILAISAAFRNLDVYLAGPMAAVLAIFILIDIKNLIYPKDNN
tara:strand:- start:2472 stop:3563 length:1092 start_codon:yes stop_codon:yes gene_type:complete